METVKFNLDGTPAGDKTNWQDMTSVRQIELLANICFEMSEQANAHEMKFNINEIRNVKDDINQGSVEIVWRK